MSTIYMYIVHVASSTAVATVKIKDTDAYKKVVRITLRRSLLLTDNSYKLVTKPPPPPALFEKEDLNCFLYYRLSFHVIKNI